MGSGPDFRDPKVCGRLQVGGLYLKKFRVEISLPLFGVLSPRFEHYPLIQFDIPLKIFEDNKLTYLSKKVVFEKFGNDT